MATYRLRASQRDEFTTRGFAYLEGYVAPDLLDGLRLKISSWTAAYAREVVGLELPVSSKAEDFDAGLLHLREVNAEGAGRVYDAIKKVPLFMQWASAGEHVALASQLLASDDIGVASRGWGMRIDYPGDIVHTTQLHQDVVSQLCGPRGVVVWAPLRSVTVAMGPMILYPGSHQHGVFPIEERGSKSQDFVIRDEAGLRRQFDGEAPLVAAGDAVAVDFLLLHESGFNASDLPRWSMLTRLFDAADPRAVRIGWRGGLQEGNLFRDVASELV